MGDINRQIVKMYTKSKIFVLSINRFLAWSNWKGWYIGERVNITREKNRESTENLPCRKSTFILRKKGAEIKAWVEDFKNQKERYLIILAFSLYLQLWKLTLVRNSYFFV